MPRISLLRRHLRALPRHLPVEPEMPVIVSPNVSPSGAAPAPPPPPVPIAADVTTARDPLWRSTLVFLTLSPRWRLIPISPRLGRLPAAVSLRPRKGSGTSAFPLVSPALRAWLSPLEAKPRLRLRSGPGTPASPPRDATGTLGDPSN